MSSELSNIYKVLFLLYIWFMAIHMNATPEMWMVAFRLLTFIVKLSIVIFPLFYILCYITFKILITFKPDGGCEGDIQSIVAQIEQHPRQVKEFIIKMKNKIL